MKRLIIDVGTLLLVLIAASAYGEPPIPKRPPQLKKLDAWVGDWTLSGTAKDQPDEHEYRVLWRLHEHWVLDGYFLQVEQTWKGIGPTQHSLEMLSYDPARRVYTDSGFGSDGSTWSLTGSFTGSTMIENGATTGADGAATRCRMTWVFSHDWKSLAGAQRCEKGGTRWEALKVAGEKSR